MADAERASSSRAAELLNSRRPLCARHLRRAVAVSAAGGLLVIAQAWLVAYVVHRVAFLGAGLDEVRLALAAVVAIVATRALALLGAEREAHRAGAAVKQALRTELVAHILKLGPIGVSGEPTGRLVAAVTEAPQAVEPFFARYLPATRLAVILPLAILAVVLPLDWVSGLVLIVTAPLIPLFMVLIGAGAERLNQRQWRRLARMSGHFLDAVQGLATLKALGASKRQAASIARTADAYRRDTMAVLRVAFLSSLALEFFATVAIAIVAVLVGFRLLWGQMDFFHGFLVLLLAPELYLPLRTLGAAYHARMEAIGAAERIAAVLDTPVAGHRQGGRQIGHVSPPAIAFEDVRVVFPDGRVGLDGLGLEIAAGERVALVGPSGAGKSTVLNLLLGFIAPASGRILVDGVPLAEVEPRHWLARTAFLGQRPHLFEATIAGNIAMKIDGEPSGHEMERVREAARRAFANDFIDALPAGYDTVVGEHGVGLSGGEVQRIAVARLFYRDAPLVLVDEAAAHLDRQSEELVSRALEDLASGRTVIAVAHRHANVRDADRVLVLDNGRLADAGAPAALLAGSGPLARMWRRSASAGAQAGPP